MELPDGAKIGTTTVGYPTGLNHISISEPYGCTGRGTRLIPRPAKVPLDDDLLGLEGLDDDLPQPLPTTVLVEDLKVPPRRQGPPLVAAR